MSADGRERTVCFGAETPDCSHPTLAGLAAPLERKLFRLPASIQNGAQGRSMSRTHSSGTIL